MWTAGTIVKNRKFKNMVQKLLIPAQRQSMISAALSEVFSARAGVSGTEDFGTARHPGVTSGWPVIHNARVRVA